MNYPTGTIRIDFDNYTLLKRLSRKYDLSIASLMMMALGEIDDWDRLVKTYWIICKFCGKANNRTNMYCIEC